MPKRMLIDASHPEETRVVILDGQKVDEFDFESASKRPLKGNIYLAKVTRVEPSLQAAFVEYGGNRQGFLAFSEIHPDYYQIPIADRMALLAEQETEAKRRAAEDSEIVETGKAPAQDASMSADDGSETDVEDADGEHSDPSAEEPAEAHDEHSGYEPDVVEASGGHDDNDHSDDGHAEDEAPHEDIIEENAEAEIAEPDIQLGEGAQDQAPVVVADDSPLLDQPAENGMASQPQHQTKSLQRRPPARWSRRHRYKIQEVIKRRQILLVQVVKEERGNKGAALTTFLSLPGRYCVLMPNTPRGGGISRKITNPNDRKRLKSAAQALELPEGMGLIIRTAGESRTKTEIKRDYEYLLKLWDSIRELTLKSNAPACVYEEGNLIKRSIRDLYNKDIGEVVVEGDEGYRSAKEFMRMLMPSHAKNVKQYREPQPLFQRMNIESQLDAMFQPVVHLKSGGYVVMNQTEALVSIDVNSGRATREHSIEETAHKTNLEAADEIARQLRLRDLAGLIVIDFIDMEDQRNNRDVEKRLYNAVKNDRARIQIGKISQFGLLEMSRQRLRAGVIAGSTVPCPHCGGQGIVRSVESTTLRLLRTLEEEGQRQRASALAAQVPNDVAIYALNQKRRELARLEQQYDIAIEIEPKEGITAGTFEIVRTATRTAEEIAARQAAAAVSVEAGFATTQDEAEPEEPEVAEEADAEEEEIEAIEASGNDHRQHSHQPHHHHNEGQPGEGGRRRRRRRRRGRGRDRQQPGQPDSQQHRDQQYGGQQPVELASPPGGESMPIPSGGFAPNGEPQQQQNMGNNGEGGGRRRRRRRRRGRGNREGQQNFGQQNPNQRSDYQPEPSRFSSAIPGGDFEIDTTPKPIEPPHRHEPAEAPVPNAASTPVWSLSQERGEQTSQPKADEVRANEPQQVKSEEPAGPSRKGWWQRTFRG